MTDFSIEFLDPRRLLPHEETVNCRVLELISNIASKGNWTTFLLVERHSLVIMDGHHRRAAAIALSLPLLPCLMLSYEFVSVETTRPEQHATPEEIISRGKRGELFPSKTTRHLLPNPPPDLLLPLSLLRSAADLQGASSYNTLRRPTGRLLCAAGGR